MYDKIAMELVLELNTDYYEATKDVEESPFEFRTNSFASHITFYESVVWDSENTILGDQEQPIDEAKEKSLMAGEIGIAVAHIGAAVSAVVNIIADMGEKEEERAADAKTLRQEI